MPDQQQYNFVGAGGGGMSVLEKLRASRQDPQWRLNVALKQQTLEMNRAQMLDAAAKREIGVRQKQGWAAINSMVASPNFSFDNQESEKALLGAASRYGIPVDAMEPYLKRFDASKQYRIRSDAIDRISGMAEEQGLQLDSLGMSATGEPTYRFSRPEDKSAISPQTVVESAEYEKLLVEFMTMPEGPEKEARRKRLDYMEGRALGGAESQAARDLARKRARAEYISSNSSTATTPEGRKALGAEFDRDVWPPEQSLTRDEAQQAPVDQQDQNPGDDIKRVFMDWYKSKQGK